MTGNARAIQLLNEEIEALEANIAKGEAFKLMGYGCDTMLLVSEGLLATAKAKKQQLLDDVFEVEDKQHD